MPGHSELVQLHIPARLYIMDYSEGRTPTAGQLHAQVAAGVIQGILNQGLPVCLRGSTLLHASMPSQRQVEVGYLTSDLPGIVLHGIGISVISEEFETELALETAALYDIDFCCDRYNGRETPFETLVSSVLASVSAQFNLDPGHSLQAGQPYLVPNPNVLGTSSDSWGRPKLVMLPTSAFLARYRNPDPNAAVLTLSTGAGFVNPTTGNFFFTEVHDQTDIAAYQEGTSNSRKGENTTNLDNLRSPITISRNLPDQLLVQFAPLGDRMPKTVEFPETFRGLAIPLQMKIAARALASYAMHEGLSMPNPPRVAQSMGRWLASERQTAINHYAGLFIKCLEGFICSGRPLRWALKALDMGLFDHMIRHKQHTFKQVRQLMQEFIPKKIEAVTHATSDWDTPYREAFHGLASALGFVSDRDGFIVIEDLIRPDSTRFCHPLFKPHA